MDTLDYTSKQTVNARIRFRSQLYRFIEKNKLVKNLFSRIFPIYYKNNFRSGIKMCAFDKFILVIDYSEVWQRNLFYSMKYEPALNLFLEKILLPGDIYVDIGANIGWHTISMLTKCPELKMVYAFEPSRKAFIQLQESISLNNLTNRCQIFNVALSDIEGKKTLKSFPELGGLHSSLFPLADWKYEEEEVNVTTLDRMAVSFIAPPSVIKCDVEGSELNVLAGAKETMSGKFGNPPIWLLEANYETSGMAGYFPWQMIEYAKTIAPYEVYSIRNGYAKRLESYLALRHGDIFILSIPEFHIGRFSSSMR
ncbi:MAG: FkbM family methyltransferase [Chloroflexota bacterium]